MPDFFAPDAFPGDPYGWLTNQAGHFVLGLVLFAVLAWMTGRRPALAWLAALYAGWEAWQLTIVWDIADAVADWLFVMLGGAFGHAASHGRVKRMGAALVALVAGLAAGTWRRK